MAETQTIARPYARAAFEAAQAQGRLSEWSDAVGALAQLAQNETLAQLIGNPKVSVERLSDLVLEAAGGALDDSNKNFVRLLVDEGRLTVAPAIAELFEQMRAEAENRIDVLVTAATEIGDEQRAALEKALHARLGRDVRVEVATDPDLIGGAVIRAGDLVIDGSVRGELERMNQVLGN